MKAQCGSRKKPTDTDTRTHVITWRGRERGREGESGRERAEVEREGERGRERGGRGRGREGKRGREREGERKGGERGGRERETYIVSLNQVNEVKL